MARDFYSDEPEMSGPSPATETESDSTSKTAVIDAAVSPGLRVGDEITLTVQKVMDGEYLVSASAGGEEESAEQPPGPPAGAESESGIASMME